MSIDRGAHRTEAIGRRGSAAVVVTATIVALLGLVVIGMLAWSTATGEAAEPLGPSRAPGGPTVTAGPELEPDAMRASSPIQVGDLEYKDLGKVFTGRGTISGIVDAEPGVPFPTAWELVIEPSRFGLGREHAESRVVPMGGAQRTFEEHDLPLAGYRVRARAEGLDCPAQEVLLFKLEGQEHLPGASHKHVMLRFARAGVLDGVVRDESGAPVAELPVFVDRRDGEWRAEVATNGAGAWRVDGLTEGPYRISLGSRTRPLLPATDVVFAAPALHLPDAVLPRLGSVVLRAVDESGRGLPAATVRGFGPAPIDTETDLIGDAHVRFLPPGRYQVRVQHADSGSEGKLDFEVAAEDDGREIQVACRPR